MMMPENLTERVVELAIKIQQTPAPTFEEGQRAALLRGLFEQEGLVDVSVDEVGNVYTRLPGSGEALPVVVSAHLDTVFPAGTDLAVRREGECIYGPGIGDNSLGLAGLFGLLWGLRERQGCVAGDVWLVANVGEEGLGDLRGMRAVVDRFGSRVRAYLVLEGMSFGQVYHRGLGVRRYRITVRTGGGHSWVDYGQPSAIHVLGGLVTRLATLQLPVTPRSTLNVGVISGGTSVNTIAAEASLLLDLRSESASTLAWLAGEVEGLCRKTEGEGVQVALEIVGERPAGEIAANHPLVRLAANSLEAQGVQPRLNIGSTDANVPLSRGLPAVTLGLTSGGGAHTLGEFINTPPLEKGLAQLLAVVEGVFKVMRL